MGTKSHCGVSAAGWNVSDMIIDKTVKASEGSIRLASGSLKGLSVSTHHAVSSASDYIIRRSPKLSDQTDDIGAHMAQKALSSGVLVTRTSWRIERNLRFNHHLKKAHRYSVYSFFESISPQHQLKYRKKARRQLAKVNRTRNTFHLGNRRNLNYYLDNQGGIRVNRSSLKQKKERGTIASIASNRSRILFNQVYGSNDFSSHAIGAGLRSAWNVKRWGATGLKAVKHTVGLAKALVSFIFALVTGLPAAMMALISSVPVIIAVVVVSLIISIFTVTSGSASSRVDSLAAIIESLQSTYSQHIDPVDLLCISYGLGWTSGGENGEFYENMCKIIYKERKDEELSLAEQCRILLVDHNPSKNPSYVKYKYGWDDTVDKAKIKKLTDENAGTGKNAFEIVSLQKSISRKNKEFERNVGSVYPSFFQQSVGSGRKNWGSEAHIRQLIAEITSKNTYKYNYDLWDKVYGFAYGSTTGTAIATAALTEMNLYHTRWIQKGKSGQHYRDWAKSRFNITVPADAWCATWTWYVLVNDVKLFKGNEIKSFPSTVAMWNYFEKKKLTHRANTKYVPQKGDLVFWRHANGGGGHVGIITDKDKFVSGNEADDVRSASIKGQKGSGALYGYVSLNIIKEGAGDLDGNLETLRGDTNASKAWNYLKNRGLSDESASAVIGNLMQESGFNPYMNNASGTGICSWIGDRKNRMMRSAPGGKWKDLSWQLKFMYYELAQRKQFSQFTSGKSSASSYKSYYPSYPSSGSDQVTKKTWDFMIMFEYNSIKGFQIAHNKKASNGAPADMFPKRVSYEQETYRIRKGKSDHWKLFN